MVDGSAAVIFDIDDVDEGMACDLAAVRFFEMTNVRDGYWSDIYRCECIQRRPVLWKRESRPPRQWRLQSGRAAPLLSMTAVIKVSVSVV